MVVITDGMMNEDEDRLREERGTSSRRCGAEGAKGDAIGQVVQTKTVELHATTLLGVSQNPEKQVLPPAKARGGLAIAGEKSPS